jgi:hypothetical protein
LFKGCKAQHLIGASKNYANLPVWVRFSRHVE